MSYKDNKWLIVKDTVIMTPVIEAVVVALDKYFEKHQLKAYVTSGLRDAQAQLVVIRQYLRKKGLDSKYPLAMSCEPHDKLLNGEYTWQMAWSNLLNIGVIINPPLDATCLMNYINASGVNRKGQIIHQTPHSTGRAVNLGGGNNGVMDELAVVQDAMANGVPIKSYLTERENNCLHLNL